MAGSPRPEPLLPQASAALALLRLRLVISVASAASVDPLPDLCLSLVLRQVSDLVLLLLRRVVLAGLATLPLLAPLRLRWQASVSELLRLRQVALAGSVAAYLLPGLRLRPDSVCRQVSGGLLPDLLLSPDLALRPTSVSAGSVLPLLRLLHRRLASGLAQHLFLPLGSVLPASLRLRS